MARENPDGSGRRLRAGLRALWVKGIFKAIYLLETTHRLVLASPHPSTTQAVFAHAQSQSPHYLQGRLEPSLGGSGCPGASLG